YFNLLIAEQTNVWLGGYHSICCKMVIDKYHFFLDEMIMRRNLTLNIVWAQFLCCLAVCTSVV
ncbi:hypothetical protein L208DRAFT_1324528, partial [Tricholoma matsutake]